MAYTNNILTTQYLLNTFMSMMMNKPSFLTNSNRLFDHDFVNQTYAPGYTINYRMPALTTIGSGPTIIQQGVTDVSRPITIEEQYNTNFTFQSQEFTLKVKSDEILLKRYVLPSMNQLQNKLDAYVVSKLRNVNRIVGTPGVPVSGWGTIQQAKGLLLKYGVPQDGQWHCGLNVDSWNSAFTSFLSNFTPVHNDKIFETGEVIKVTDLNMFENVNLQTIKQIAGSGGGGAPVGGFIAAGHVSAVVSSGNTIPLAGLPASTNNVFNAYDIIKLTTVNGTNPVGSQPDDTGVVASFVIQPNPLTMDGSWPTDGTGAVTVTVSPYIDTSTPYQNITKPIPINEPVLLAATHQKSFVYQKDMLLVAMPKMKELNPATTKTVYAGSPKYNISMRYTTGADIVNDANIDRVDTFIGAALNPEYGVCILCQSKLGRHFWRPFIFLKGELNELRKSQLHPNKWPKS